MENIRHVQETDIYECVELGADPNKSLYPVNLNSAVHFLSRVSGHHRRH